MAQACFRGLVVAAVLLWGCEGRPDYGRHEDQGALPGQAKVAGSEAAKEVPVPSPAEEPRTEAAASDQSSSGRSAVETEVVNSVSLPPEITSAFSRLHDPQTVCLTEPVAKVIANLPAAQREAAIARLKRALQSERVQVRRRAALVLGALGDKSGVPVMIRDLSVEDERDRGDVAVALRVLEDPRAVPVLMKAVADPSPYVRAIALEALGEMRADNAFEIIVARLADKEERGGCMGHTPAHSACYALGAIGDKKAIPLLIRALDDRLLESVACQALGELTGEDFEYDVARWKQWWAERGRE